MDEAGGCDSWPDIRMARSEGRIVNVTKAREDNSAARGTNQAPYLHDVRVINKI
jgi:hypothetical protein